LASHAKVDGWQARSGWSIRAGLSHSASPRTQAYNRPMEAIGPLLVLLSLPLMFRWVPPNRFFGLRIASTLRNRSVWYDANALSARHLFSLGLCLVLLEFVLPRSIRIEALRVIASIGFASIIIFDWRTANRWERERRNAVASLADRSRELRSP
jgi:hypothetical protein